MTKINLNFLAITLLSTFITVSGCNRTESTDPLKTDTGTEESQSATDPGMDDNTDPDSDESAPMTASMTTSEGKVMTLTMKSLPDSRDYLYCELVFDYGEKGYDLYSTSHLGEASLEWWNNLDLAKVAEDYGAVAVLKNGPQRWSMDEVSLMFSEPVAVGDSKMVFGGHLPPGTMKLPKYTVFNPKKTQNLQWQAGKPVYQLVDPDGHVYVLQGYKVATEDLATLADKFEKLPEGWKYRVQVLDEDLVMNLSPQKAIPSVQDEFNQIYIRIPK